MGKIVLDYVGRSDVITRVLMRGRQQESEADVTAKAEGQRVRVW